jgi:hypothetical protein
MARTYHRDKLGRFASKGYSGQSAGRGARLMATGSRAGGGARITREGAGSRIRKPSSAKPSTQSKRVLVNADLRPHGVFSRATKKTPGYGQDAKANVEVARKQVAAAGYTSSLKSNKRSSSVAYVAEGTTDVVFNRSHSAWKNPRADAIKSRRKNEFSTAKPGHYVAHELGHIRNPSGQMAGSWTGQAKGKSFDARMKARDRNWKIANRVSQYAKQSPAEFAAETSAALRLGKRYDRQVMGLYRDVTRRRLEPLQSQQRRQGAGPGYVSPRISRRRR